MAKVKKSLGESLIEEWLVTPEQLKQAQEEERRSGLRLRKAVVKLGFVEEEDLVTFLSARMGIPRIELTNYIIDPKVVELVPESMARQYEAVPVLKIGNRLTCALVDPWNILALDALRNKTNMIIEPAVACEEEIKKALDEHYGARGRLEDVLSSIEGEDLGLKEDKEMDLKKLEGAVKEPIVIKLVHLIILEAVKVGASDIHVEPEKESLKIRFRVDGILRDIPAPPKHLQSAVISRIKILANLDIAERRVPQDGRFNMKMEKKEIDVRVSCMPSLYGENVVLRLLDVSSAFLSLPQLGFSSGMLERYEKLIRRHHGVLLVTGPTGSGKTTTLYSSLNKINDIAKNIITIEDPVEYRLEGIRQTQINPKVNLTFANGLRSMLRQDPDVIMVGEIRDRETAEIAIQAALTGHLVLSTLHTNDAPGAIARLIDMGVEPFLIASSVIGILAQRLVRMICKECKKDYLPTPEELQDMGLAGKEGKYFAGAGCIRCLKTGYKGRIGIFELLIPDELIRRLAIAKGSAEEIRRAALNEGMVSLKGDGIQKIGQGVTTLEEVLRATQDE